MLDAGIEASACARNSTIRLRLRIPSDTLTATIVVYNENLAIGNRSHVSCSDNTLRASIVTRDLEILQLEGLQCYKCTYMKAYNTAKVAHVSTSYTSAKVSQELLD